MENSCAQNYKTPSEKSKTSINGSILFSKIRLINVNISILLKLVYRFNINHN